MKLILSFIFTLFIITSGAQNREIKFETYSMKEALIEAQKSQKIIFIDCYTSWCAPCKALSKNIFTVDKVADHFNNNYINLKLDCEKGEGITVASQFGVSSYPTLLFIDSNGTLVHRICGYMSADELLANINEGMNPETSLQAKKAKFNNGEKDIDFLIGYFNELNRLSYYDDAELAAKRILSLKKESELFCKEMWPIVSFYNLSRYGTERWNFLIDNSERFISIVGNDTFCNRIFETIHAYLFRYIMGNYPQNSSKNDFKEFKSLIDRFNMAEKNTLISFSKMGESRYNDSFSKFLKTFLNEIDNLDPKEHYRLWVNTVNYFNENATDKQKKLIHRKITESKKVQNEYMANFFDELHTKIK